MQIFVKTLTGKTITLEVSFLVLWLTQQAAKAQKIGPCSVLCRWSHPTRSRMWRLRFKIRRGSHRTSRGLSLPVFDINSEQSSRVFIHFLRQAAGGRQDSVRLQHSERVDSPSCAQVLSQDCSQENILVSGWEEGPRRGRRRTTPPPRRSATSTRQCILLSSSITRLGYLVLNTMYLPVIDNKEIFPGGRQWENQPSPPRVPCRGVRRWSLHGSPPRSPGYCSLIIR